MKKSILCTCISLSAVVAVISCKKDSSENVLQVVDNEQELQASVAIIKKAMVDFRKSLSDEVLAKCSNDTDSERLYKWHNTPAGGRGKRDGITYADLSDTQLNSFKKILQLFLSTDGYQKVREITVVSEGWLSEVKSDFWNPKLYSIDMFGDPEKDEAWGFQLDGHHCVVNFIVQKDNVSIVPAFLGAEPAKQTYKGEQFDIFHDERELALKLYGEMDAKEKAAALSKSEGRSLQVGPADRPGEPDPYINDYDYSIFKKGLKFSHMSDPTKANLKLLIKEYVYNMNHTFAETWWSDIEENLDDTYFVWIDNVEEPTSTSSFYYRIYNPYLWVEYNVENITRINKDNMESWNHVHTITRIPNHPKTSHGGDYGKFVESLNKNNQMTLLDHYAGNDHHGESRVEFDYMLSRHRQDQTHE